MADKNDELQNLRQTIPTIIANIETWATFPQVCQKLGLPQLESLEGSSKHQVVSNIVAMANNHTVIKAAELMINAYPGNRGGPNEEQRQNIQDCLWRIESECRQLISTVVRFDIAEVLGKFTFWGRCPGLQDFFKSAHIYVKEYHGAFAGNDGLLYQDRSISTMSDLLDNFIPAFREPIKKTSAPPPPVKVTVLSFLQIIGIDEWPDQRFILFVERVVHPEVQKPDDQSKMVQQIGALLEKDGFEFRTESTQGGSPVYKIRKKSAGVQGSPKYVIFAPIGVKPDIVLTDAVNMEIQIASDADKCIVYDQPPPSGDLTWDMLVEWWCRKNGLSSSIEENRRKFGLRLRESFQSEPERILFDTYFKGLRPKYGSNLPALLPQVYLHFDPRSQRTRMKPVLFRQRMDFLMLLRNSIRIIIEIDGVQHYSNNDGQAVPQRYAATVAEDRRIKLLGYEVYRFGGAEFINEETAIKVITDFFNELFEHYDIKPVKY